MTSNLSDQIRKALAFDPDFSKEYQKRSFVIWGPVRVNYFRSGGEVENKRLAPIHEKLLVMTSLAEQVASHDSRCDWTTECNCLNFQLKKALTELREVVKNEE